MFLNEKTSKPERNAFWYSANRVFAGLFVQGLAVGLCLAYAPLPSSPDGINLRETLAPALTMGTSFAIFWWLTKKGMDAS